MKALHGDISAKQLEPLAHTYGITLMILFGSAAKGNMHARSYVDIAVLLKRKISLKSELELRHKLSKMMNREVDLAFLTHASPLLLGQIAIHGKLLYGSINDFAQFRVHAIKEYIDFKPYFDLRVKTINKTLNTYA